MSSPAPFEPIADLLARSLSIKHVYGEPVHRGDTTVIPVARVAYGFGAGGGRRPRGARASGLPDSSATSGNPASGNATNSAATGRNTQGSTAQGGNTQGGNTHDTNVHDNDAADSSRTDAQGAGGGGGVRMTPVGALEIGPQGTRFVHFRPIAPLAVAAAIGVLAGLLLGRPRS